MKTHFCLHVGLLSWIGLALIWSSIGSHLQVGNPIGDRDESLSQPCQPIEVAGIENLHRLSSKIYSGGQPEDQQAFASLHEYGIQTILSVDGAIPQVEAARALGMRYVHIPIGYDRLTEQEAVRIAAALRSLPGPIFVHCQHGKHRGPTAAALGAITLEGWSAKRAETWLEQAGTSRDYAGLYQTVEQFVRPTDERLDAAGQLRFPEQVEPPQLIEAMVQISQRWDHLQAIQKAGFRPPADHPDLDPAHEALLLAEHYRELGRMERGISAQPEFRSRLSQAEQNAWTLARAFNGRQTARLDQSRFPELEEQFRMIQRDCRHCHRRYRNGGTSIN